MTALGSMEYCLDERRPVVLVHGAGGGSVAWAFDPHTGGFVVENDLIAELAVAPGVERLTRVEFVQAVEAERGDRLHGDGPQFVLYAEITSIERRAWRQDRRLSPEEEAYVRMLRRRAHEIFEADLAARGIMGMPV
jgi:hypothetical protein